MRDIDNAKDFDIVCQRDGNVFVSCLPDDTIVVPRASTIALLQVTLTAIRMEGDEEKLRLAAKVCGAHLGALP